MTVELVRPAREWWHDRLEIARLIAWYEDGAGPPVDGFAYLVEKPWKFASEYAEMRREEQAERLADEDEAFTELERRRGL